MVANRSKKSHQAKPARCLLLAKTQAHACCALPALLILVRTRSYRSRPPVHEPVGCPPRPARHWRSSVRASRGCGPAWPKKFYEEWSIDPSNEIKKHRWMACFKWCLLVALDACSLLLEVAVRMYIGSIRRGIRGPPRSTTRRRSPSSACWWTAPQKRCWWVSRAKPEFSRTRVLISSLLQGNRQGRPRIGITGGGFGRSDNGGCFTLGFDAVKRRLVDPLHFPSSSTTAARATHPGRVGASPASRSPRTTPPRVRVSLHVQQSLLVCPGKHIGNEWRKTKGLFGLFIYHFQFNLFFKTLNEDEVNGASQQGRR
jgi:hypothetical protein